MLASPNLLTRSVWDIAMQTKTAEEKQIGRLVI
jgi:hypothetical protein